MRREDPREGLPEVSGAEMVGSIADDIKQEFKAYSLRCLRLCEEELYQ